MADPILPAQLRIGNVTACRSLLLALLENSEQVVRLDGSLVTEIDTAGLQLLLAFSRSALAKKQVVHIIRASSVLQQCLALAGVCDRFVDAWEKGT